MKFSDDTIAAISTATGNSGISIIRISGKNAYDIAQKIYKGKNISFSDIKNKTIRYGHIIDAVSGNIIDEVLISRMDAPNTYTGENVVEINAHGGATVAGNVLKTVLDAGARLAQPGEFTKRAFLNSRIDLIQAEAVMDVINAKTDYSLSAAQERLTGHLSENINSIKNILLDALSYIGVGIEYPEYDIEETEQENILSLLNNACDKLDKLYNSYKKGQILNEGLKVAIVGKPNVGKSLLLNDLTNSDRSIVTDIPGTTRDIVSEMINIGGIPIKVIDTAGIRESENKVEQIGISRSIDAIKKAQVVIFVLDISRKWDKEDEEILSLLKNKDTIYVANKNDLKSDTDIIKRLKDYDIIYISALTKEGIEKVEEKIKEYSGLKAEDVINEAIVANVRHENLIKNALISLKSAIDGIEDNTVIDMAEIDIKDCLDCIYEITGQAIDDDIIDRIFANFCLGK
ncbi:MAG: tRNA uridine-5-carboxymethylaminomethyl(34) synthesis GTPase MnmE [Eubacteriaceae bacterium]